MTHFISLTSKGQFGSLYRYAFMIAILSIASLLTAQTCPLATTTTGSISLLSDCTIPNTDIIKSGDALQIPLEDCSTYTFMVCYNEAYDSPERDQVQIQLSNSAGFYTEASALPKGCAEITYTAGVNDFAIVQAFSHSCLADWKEWDITITKSCCNITPNNTVSVTANQADCTAPAFSIDLPLISLGCDATVVSYVILPALANPPSPLFAVSLLDGQLDIPAGNPIGTYTINWSVLDCLGNTTTTATQSISINPVVACNDQVNLSIPNGVLSVQPYMLAEEIADLCVDDYAVSISKEGLSLGNQISCSYSGQLLEYTLTHISTGLACTGNILVEDKTGPVITCTDTDIACSADSSPAGVGTPQVIDNCDPNPSLSSFDQLIDYECSNANYLSTIQRTWIATDTEGNSSSCVQTINIIRPTLSGLTFPDEITIDCKNANTDPSHTGGPSISTMISGSQCNFIILYEDSETAVCSGTTKIVRRWTVKDWCSGGEENDTQIIIVKDSTGPEINCPDAITFGANENSCDATVTLPIATATDDCSEHTTVSIDWEFGTGEGPFMNVPIGEYTATYTAADDCGNTNQCPVTISIIDNIIPVAVCDLNTTVGIGQSQASMICAEDLDSGSYDNCELVSREIRLVGDVDYTDCISLSCAQVGQTLMVQMQVTDLNGLQNHCTVSVDVFDKLPPIITNCAQDIVLSCDANINDTALTGFPSAEDNCTFQINYTDVNNLNECNIGEIIRTFIATDNSNSSSTCTQTITLVDNTAPIVTFSEDITLVCVDKNDEIGKPTVEDNCGKFGFYFTDEDVDNGDCMQSFKRTWEVLNLCTEERVSQTTKVTLLNDTTLPQFSGAPAEITINCNDAIPDFIAPTITDLCDSDLVIDTSTTDISSTCPALRVITKTYTATDGCGNSNSFSQSIRLIDNQGPTFVDFPADQTINCDEEIDVNFPSFIDACDDSPTITFSQDTVPGECPNEMLVFRTYTLTDQCSNTTNAVQLFHFVDNVPPIIRGQTNDLTIPCQFPIPAFDLGAIDNCDNNLSIDFVDTSIPGDCPNEEIVTRVYTVADDCGNATLDTIVLTIVDNSAPSLTASNLIENLTISCSQEFPVIDFTVIDNCDADILINESRDTTGDKCNAIVIRTFTATDDCGNASTLVQNLSIKDNQAPFFSTFPQDQDVTIFSGESVQVEVIDASVLDDCSDSNDVNFVIDYFSDGDQAEEPNIFVDGNNASGVYPLGVHTISFSATDDCGNSLSQDLKISVFDFSPSSLCRSVTLEIGENGLLLVEASSILNDPNIINDPNISSITFVNPSNFTQVIGSNLLLDCNNLGANQFAIQITSTDDSNTICSNMINLIDPDTRCGSTSMEATVAGKVFSVNGTAMPDVQMHLTESESKNEITDQFGIYAFDNLPIGSACQVRPENDTNHPVGVSAYDLVLVMQHILQTKKFTNPYQHIAADVDMNGAINLFDLVEIRSLILYQTTSFGVCPSYRFVEANYQFSNPENPLAENFSEAHFCASVEETMIDLDFISIKMGDIDGTIPASLTQDIISRSSSSILLSFEDLRLSPGEETLVNIYTEDIDNLASIQFAMGTENADLIGIETDASMQKNYNHIDGRVHFAWTRYDEELPRRLLQLRIKSDQSILLSEVLKLDPITPAVQFSNSGIKNKIKLESMNQSSISTVNILEQNVPNPFTKSTLIPFYLHHAGVAKIHIYDFAGKEIYHHSESYPQGWHQHEYTASNLAPGIYMYTLQQGNETQTKKMVITR